MNVTDLGAELQARATQLPVTSAALRMAGVRARLRTRRRRQAGALATITVAVASLVVVGFSPIGGNLLVDRSPSPASSTKAKSIDRYAFDDVLAGDPLITAIVGKRGQRDVQITFTPLDTNLSISAFCDIKGAPASVTDTLLGQVMINGQLSLSAGCLDGAGTNSASDVSLNDTPADRRARMATLGVLPGRPSVLRITLVSTKDEVTSNQQVRLGVGLYEMSAPRLTSDGVVIPELAESYPHNYALVSYRTARITRTTRSLTLSVPAAKMPGWVTGGNITTDDASVGTATTLLVDSGGRVELVGGGVGGLPIGAAATTVRVQVSPRSTGTMMLAYYQQTD